MVINENYGTPEIIKDLAIDILNEVYKKWFEEDNRCELKFDCDFIPDKTLYVWPTNVRVRAAYLYDKGQTNNKTVIVINPLFKDNYLYATLIHELTHVYEDAVKSKRNASIKNYCEKNGMRKMQKYMLSKDDRTDVKDELLRIIYMLQPHEQNAFISSMFTQFSESFADPENAEEALYYIYSTPAYERFEQAIDMAENLYINETDKSKQKEILSAVKELTSFNFKTYQQFANWLKFKIGKLKRKLSTIIPKMVQKFFDEY